MGPPGQRVEVHEVLEIADVPFLPEETERSGLVWLSALRSRSLRVSIGGRPTGLPGPRAPAGQLGAIYPTGAAAIAAGSGAADSAARSPEARRRHVLALGVILPSGLRHKGVWEN